MDRVTEAHINLGALRDNARLAGSLAPGSRLLAVVKANAYGHGAREVAHALHGIADAFAVARIDEARSLRRAGIAAPIVLLSTLPDAAQLVECARERLDIVVHEATTLRRIAAQPLPRPIGVWLKIDTGMHRLGIPPEAAPVAFATLSALPWVSQVTLMSHFASADDEHSAATDAQLACFDACTEGLDAPVSLANSAAILCRPDSHREWIRPGIMLYGANPLPDRQPLRPVMTLCSNLLAVREIEAGASVGYNGSWTSTRRALIGTVAAGYGDGYPRHAPSGTPVLVNGQRVPLVGRVSMDMITVDLSDQPAAAAGDPVELWGAALPVEEIARCAGTIAYELLTRVTERPRRIYRDR